MTPDAPYPHRRTESSPTEWSRCVCKAQTAYGQTPESWGRDCHVALREALATAQGERDSAYQRGCRDALTDAGKQLDTMADQYEARADETEASPGYRAGRANVIALHVQDLRTEAHFRQAADLCRALAERCPDDPQETTP